MKKHTLEQIYTKYYYNVYLYALSLSKSPHEAEDLVSETFYRALLSLDDNHPSVKYWLFRVCKNLFLNQLHTNTRLSSKPVDELTETIPDEAIDRIIKTEEARILYKGILLLPDNYRDILFMFYFQNYNIKMLCKLSGKSQTTVKTTLHRARTRLKELIKEDINGL